jgi:uncharacterized membrane protein YedE/YeeE
MTEFTPVSGLFGGVLIGLAAVLLMACNGRIAGISGIVGGLLPPWTSETWWRLAFVVGLVAAPLVYALLAAEDVQIGYPHGRGLMVAGGFLVGLGTRLGSGCTSGHGVCGMARLSPRSLVATVTFIATGVATVFILHHVVGS